MDQKTYYYLALGDSYTIGEAIPFEENFPSQVTRILEKKINIITRVIAKTGWTTDELEDGIQKSGAENPFRDNYDFVSLLIGVNNQYRRGSVEDYAEQFEKLLNKAIKFSGNNEKNVIVLSIPDWGVTPYAEGRNRKQITEEIDEYNNAAKKIANNHSVQFEDITPWTREASKDPGLLASDGLHPSSKEYKRWADMVARYFLSKIT